MSIYTALLRPVVTDAVQTLLDFASGPLFAEKFALVFGTPAPSLADFRSALAQLPEIEVLADEVLEGALGAFSAQTGKIYLSESVVNGDMGRLQAILLEEIGHYLDSVFNTQDSAGDEGAIFAGLVLGKMLAPSELQVLRGEDDTEIIGVNGGVIAAEQSVLSTYANTVLLDSPLAYWRLDETSGNTAADFSGNGYNATYIGGVGLGSPGGINSGTSANFYGLNDYIDTPLSSNLQNLTVEAWFKADVTTGERSIVDSDISGRSGQSLILGYWDGDGTLDIEYHGTPNSYDSPFVVQANTWYHAVSVFTLGKVELYVNGQLIGSHTYTPQLLDGSNFRIGRHNSGDPQWFDGLIDEVAIYGYALNPSQIQNHYQAGVGEGETFTGTTGNDTLNGTTGADTLIGLAGNDTYTVNNAGDVVVENFNEGTDTIKSDRTYTLPNNVEKLTLNGSTNLNGTGNELNNTLTGNSGANTLTGLAGNDTLDGKAGADTMIGGLGNDTYTIDNIGDVVVENPNEGTDTIKTNFTHTLGSDFENLTLLGTDNLNGTSNAVNNKLTGNSGNNTLTGLAGNDTLDGKAGADTMIGGLGNDAYTVDNIGDVVTENLNEGTDTVKASISYTLGANLENLTLSGTANLNGTGNALNNKLTGNSGANILNGGAGADTLAGKDGNDTFVFRFGESTVTALDRVSDFAIGADKIDLLTQGGAATGAPAAFTRAADSATTNVNTIVANVFTDANGATAGNQALELNSAALVLAGTSTYLIVNDGAAGFQSPNDLVINLTGITGTLPALGSIPVGNFFV